MKRKILKLFSTGMLALTLTVAPSQKSEGVVALAASGGTGLLALGVTLVGTGDATFLAGAMAESRTLFMSGFILAVTGIIVLDDGENMQADLGPLSDQPSYLSRSEVDAYNSHLDELNVHAEDIFEATKRAIVDQQMNSEAALKFANQKWQKALEEVKEEGDANLTKAYSAFLKMRKHRAN